MWPAHENRLRHQYWMDRSSSGGQWDTHFVTLYRVSYSAIIFILANMCMHEYDCSYMHLFYENFL